MLVLLVLLTTFCLCLVAWQHLSGERLRVGDGTTSPPAVSKTTDITADSGHATTERRPSASTTRASRPASTRSSAARRSEGLSLAWVAITALLVTGAACTRWVFSRHGRPSSPEPPGLVGTSDPGDEEAGFDQTEPEGAAPEPGAPLASGSAQLGETGRTEAPAAAPVAYPAGLAATPAGRVATPAGLAAPRTAVPVVGTVSDPGVQAAHIRFPRAAAAEAGPPDLRGTGPDESRRVLVDRRMKPRVPYEAPARLRWRGSELAVTTQDLSESGVRVRLPRLRPQDPPVPLHLELVTILLTVAGTELAIRSEVRFRRPSEDGADLGLQFQDLPEADTERLRDVVRSVEQPVP